MEWFQSAVSHMWQSPEPNLCELPKKVKKNTLWASTAILILYVVHIFWEGHKILRNLHLLIDLEYIEQIIGGDFAKFCGLLRIYELYTEFVKPNSLKHTECFDARGDWVGICNIFSNFYT